METTVTGTIGPKRYRILFFGAFAPHMARVDAAAVLKQMLQVPDDKLAACLSGRKVALRRDLDEAAARQWLQRLLQAGLEVTVEPPLPARTAASPPAPPARPADPETVSGAASNDPVTASAPAPQRRLRPRGLLFGAAALILAALAAAVWQLLAPTLADWRTSRAMAAAMDALTPVETEINRFVERTGFLPNHALDMGKHGDSLLQSAEIERLSLGQSGQLTLAFSGGTGALAGETLILSPTRMDDGAGFHWHCAGGTLNEALWPDRCRQVVRRSTDGIPGPRLADLPRMAGLDQVALPSPSLPAVDAADPTARRLAQVIEDTLDMRLKALRHYMETMTWPASNDAVGLPPGNKLAGEHMRHLQFVEDGRIEVRFDDSLPSLAGHRFWLRPTLPGQWACESTLADDQLPVTCKTPIK